MNSCSGIPTVAIRTLLIAFLLALLAAPASAGQADHAANLARAERSALPPIQMTDADRDFVSFALERSRVKVQALESALVRARTPELRVLSETLLDEHRAIARALLELAGDDHEATVTTMAEHVELAELRQLPPEAFDQRLLDFLQQQHRETLPRYRSAGRDPQLHELVREFAAQTAPTLEFHLELTGEAEQLIAMNENGNRE